MFLKHFRNKKKNKIFREITERFGNPVSKRRAINHISTYSKFYSNTNEIIDAKTWNDLEMDEIFNFIDRTESKTGEQVLFDILHRRQATEEFKKFNSKVNYYSNNFKSLLENVHLLREYNRSSSYNLPNILLYKQPSTIPKWTTGLTAMSLSLSILCLFNSFFVLTFIAIAVINTTIHYFFKKNIDLHNFDLKNIRSLHVYFPLLLKNDNEKKILSVEEKKIVRTISKKCFFLSLNIDVADEFSSVFYYISEIVKGIFLADAVLFNSLIALINQNSNTLLKLYQYIGLVDSSIAIASLKKGTIGCEPTFITNKEINIIDAYHPLIHECQSNSITLKDKSAIITGGNMSGKTTFLKVIGINAHLAQTINYTFSSNFEIPYLKINSSIQNEDNLEKGISFFMDELLRSKQIIESVRDSNEFSLVLIDEFYKGTNSKDRITLASSVLNHLNRENCFVLATTHDLDIIDFISKYYEMFFFDNYYENKQIIFNYKINKGIQNRTNVIELIQSLDFPDEVISNAINFRIKFKSPNNSGNF